MPTSLPVVCEGGDDMELKVNVQSITQTNPEKSKNEDMLGSVGNFFWVLDGATPLSQEKYLDAESDAAWFVQTLNQSMITSITKQETIHDAQAGSEISCVMHRALSACKEDILAIYPNYLSLPKADQVSASGVFIRIGELYLEYFILSDCYLACQQRGQIQCFVDERLGRWDAISQNEIKKRQAVTGCSHQEAFQYMLPLLRQHRSLMNTEEGYWSFSVDAQGIGNALTGRLPLLAPTKILLCSDGFARIFETFQIFTIEQILEGHVRLETAVRCLREAEKQDAACMRFPRVKTYDDVTAILISVHI